MSGVPLHPAQSPTASELMYSIPLLAALSLTMLARATPLETATPTVDWKYTVGWDGVTLPANAIGSALAGSADPAARADHLGKRTVGGVYLCQYGNWQGRCGYAVQPLNTCIVLGPPWKDGIESFGPDQCTHCTAYSRGDCTETSPTAVPATFEWQFDYPGASDGGASAGVLDWVDKIASFKCTRSC